MVGVDKEKVEWPSTEEGSLYRLERRMGFLFIRTIAFQLSTRTFSGTLFGKGLHPHPDMNSMDRVSS